MTAPIFGSLPPLSGATPTQLAVAIHNIAHRGDWTPVITFATPGNLVVAYSVQVGQWAKIGRHLTLTFSLTTSTFTHTTAAGNLLVTGVPFTSENLTNQNFYGAMEWGGITKAGFTNVVARFAPNVTQLDFRASGSGVAPGNIVAADTPTAGTLVLNGTLNFWIGK